MDWHNLRAKHSSVSGILSYNNYQGLYPQTSPQTQRFPYNAYPLDKQENYPNQTDNRSSYYASQYPLYGADWVTLGNSDWVALSSFREGFQNRILVVHGQSFRRREDDENTDIPSQDRPNSVESPVSAQSSNSSDELSTPKESLPAFSREFDFHKVAEITVDYPVTNLQWDPQILNGGPGERLAASSEVLRLYKVEYSPEPTIVQTHLLANNSTANSTLDSRDINTFPPVTSFDWNTTDSSILITLSVDTTCTVWDLNRSHSLGRDKENTAQVKTQLIAHDSEVFDVKFIHQSTNVFASVSNDGSMRVFDLRSLEHSTIIYEPTLPAVPIPGVAPAHYNLQALLKLLTSNIDQNYLSTIGVNLNQVLIIDMRMPGMPVMTLDGLFGGMSSAAINHIEWHPNSNNLLTGGDDCQALVWDCSGRKTRGGEVACVVDTPVLAYLEDLEVNHVCWRRNTGDWMGVVSGKGFQAVQNS
ncbi:CIC11C00000000722 [Sungouiella intermedia]|uniref:CIC11C00000000722 n=1 Tax=Sungouiella intermedia TaxID=45354 RepID=A0A1L0C7D1_9ASCO|nr:CIC11C00000000722 [[Candida] intermedia]